MSDVDRALRELVRLRAAGLCEYCRISERLTLAEHEIDHVIAVKHGGPTAADNLALCCAVCNRFKGSDIGSLDSESGQLTPLFNSRVDPLISGTTIFRSAAERSSALPRSAARLSSFCE